MGMNVTPICISLNRQVGRCQFLVGCQDQTTVQEGKFWILGVVHSLLRGRAWWNTVCIYFLLLVLRQRYSHSLVIFSFHPAEGKDDGEDCNMNQAMINSRLADHGKDAARANSLFHPVRDDFLFYSRPPSSSKFNGLPSIFLQLSPYLRLIFINSHTSINTQHTCLVFLAGIWNNLSCLETVPLVSPQSSGGGS